ncbi:hypothetical protein PoB_002691900 [Plakobranchus ocellatus]|uniref:Uncharacterized protein n=1 Tax=Plakobranchus ocellatus TaxID=259542 RepID=A0AAV4A1F1_9GAST|nr:hypothetical protein PoB_002691900 [Plakobranchus ocellatus]
MHTAAAAADDDHKDVGRTALTAEPPRTTPLVKRWLVQRQQQQQQRSSSNNTNNSNISNSSRRNSTNGSNSSSNCSNSTNSSSCSTNNNSNSSSRTAQATNCKRTINISANKRRTLSETYKTATLPHVTAASRRRRDLTAPHKPRSRPVLGNSFKLPDCFPGRTGLITLGNISQCRT